MDSPGGLGGARTLEVELLPISPQRFEDILVRNGWLHWDASHSLGLSTGIAQGGFATGNQSNQQLQASRIYLNGHADIAWRFARDPSTVASVQLLAGHDATLLGAGSPGFALQVLSKKPSGEPFTHVQASAVGGGGLQISLDTERHIGALRTRTVLTGQHGLRTVEGVPDNRSAALLSTVLPMPAGRLQFDIEYHGSQMPFPFGMPYTGNRFWYDTRYVGPDADAQRHHRRHALYVQHRFAAGPTLDAHWQRADSFRRETLLGFFDPASASQLRGYYRLIDDTHSQGDAGLHLHHHHALGSAQHRWHVVVQTHRQQRAFSGPQNVGGFNLDVVAPVFPGDLSPLAMAPRFSFENYREAGQGAASILEWDQIEARLGVRRSTVVVDGSTSPTAPQRRLADGRGDTASIGLGYRLAGTQRLWATSVTSFLPNRGTFSGGAYLPPSQGNHHELGWAHTAPKEHVAIRMFNLRQSNVPLRDPNDRDAFILASGLRTQGAAFHARWRVGAGHVFASATRQHAKLAPTGAAPNAPQVVGMPGRFGAAGWQLGDGQAQQWGLNVQAASSLAGDAAGSFKAHGYAVWEASWQTQATKAVRWGASLHNIFDRRYVRALTGQDNAWQGLRRRLTVWADWHL